MNTAIVVATRFELIWPMVADHFRELLEPIGPTTLTRVNAEGARGLCDVVANPETVSRLIVLGLAATPEDLDEFPVLDEVFATSIQEETKKLLESRGIHVLSHNSEGFWAQSVAEFALGLTLGGLRQIPQSHHRILTSLDDWHYPTEQYADDPRFVSGTIQGKRVRIVGAGNIASRYASFAGALGADVVAWDPYASEPSFHRTGARRDRHLASLVTDADIFAPMIPLTDSTEGLVTAELIDALPTGCLVVLVTRANICDMQAIRRRVLADELSLAADVFDVEPLPLDDPLLGRHNVVHTPHRAGRTREANLQYAEMLVEQMNGFERASSTTRAASVDK